MPLLLERNCPFPALPLCLQGYAAAALWLRKAREGIPHFGSTYYVSYTGTLFLYLVDEQRNKATWTAGKCGVQVEIRLHT